jgi:hypothetical protein
MARAGVRREVEDWVRREWLPRAFGQNFSRERLALTAGGVLDFDAVSGDGKIVVSISTGAARTARGKLKIRKLTKIRVDILFLLMAACERRVVVLTDAAMFQQCQKERAVGRIPSSIEFMRAKIPSELESRLVSSREVASREVTPEDDE